MAQSSPSRSQRRSLTFALALLGLVLALIEFRRRAMQRNQARFHAQYDPTASR